MIPPKEDSISIPSLLPELGQGELGRFDFVSALACLNCTLLTYRRALNLPLKPKDRHHLYAIRSKLWHERFHFLQAITCGFLYEFANRAAERVISHLNSLPKTDDRGTDASIQKRMRDGDASGGFWGRLLPQLRPELEQLAATLRQREPIGVSTLDLIEGAAYFHERLATELESFSKSSFEKALSFKNLPDEYRRAYDFARQVVGNDAIEFYLFSILTALRFSVPPLVFHDVLILFDRLWRGKSRADTKNVTTRELERIARSNGVDLLGTALNVHKKTPPARRFTFYDTPLQLLKASHVDEYDLVDFGNRGHLQSQLVPSVVTVRDKGFRRAGWDEDHVGTGVLAIIASVCMDTVAVT